MSKVSVIVPIYNVESFIKRCAISLFEQSLKNVEYIFVDDATPDDSMKILKEVAKKYPCRANDIKILRHEKNKGLPAARNAGLSVASGDYIYHCDSDDFMESTALEQLYNMAVEHQADIVWSDWLLSFNGKERKIVEPSFSTSFDALKSMLVGPMNYNVWNKLVKRTLYTDNSISFPSGYSMGEDLTMLKLMACAKNVYYLPIPTYHYIKCNSGAMTANYTDNSLKALKYNVDKVCWFLTEKFGDKIEKEISYFKLGIKSIFLVSSNPCKMCKLWESWFPETNVYAGHNVRTAKRIRLLEWFASKKQYWLISLYYWIVIKFLYGIKYR